MAFVSDGKEWVYQPKERKRGGDRPKKSLIFHKFFRVLCFEYKIVSVPYFMDEMEEYELYDIIENLQYLDKNDWERTRLSIYSTVQMNTKKKLNPKDILTFPWEKEHEKEKVITEISNDDIQRLKNKSKAIEKIIK